jgi:hypothetical protein
MVMKTFLYLYDGVYLHIYAFSMLDAKMMLRGIGFESAVIMEVQGDKC